MGIAHLQIRSLGPMGDGVHVGPKGRVFVNRAVPGDEVRASVYHDSSGIKRADIIEVLKSSEFRRSPPCPHYDHCGNCTLQHLEHSYYRHWKTELVKDAFRRQKLIPRIWETPVFLGHSNRRRATFTVSKRNSKVVMGYYGRRTDLVTDIEACLIADPLLLELRRSVKPYLAHMLKNDSTVDLFFQLVGDAVDMVVTGVAGSAGSRDALAALFKDLPITRLSLRTSETGAVTTLYSKGPVTARFGALSVPLPPAAFLQPTVDGEKALVAAVLAALTDFSDPSGRGKFADLFSGCGTFTGPMLARGSVDAYESNTLAVNALSRAAGKSPLSVFRRDLFLKPLSREMINRYNAVVFDPPRAGCPEQVFEMASARTPILVGVSCNPATFARDARILVSGGYRLQSLQLVDQFQWSHHVEMVGVFTKKRRSS